MHLEYLKDFFEVMFMLILAGTLFSLGNFQISRGHIEKRVDGTQRKRGYIFQGWYWFWMKERGKKKIFYKGDAYQLLMGNLKAYFNGYNIESSTSGVIVVVPTFKQKPLQPWEFVGEEFHWYEDLHRLILQIQDNFSIKFDNEIYEDLGNDKQKYRKILYKPYKEEADYVFPEFLRDMMAGCMTCYASVYGSIVFWTFHLLISHHQLAELYAAFDVRCIAVMINWFWYCISLAIVNTIVWKLNK